MVMKDREKLICKRIEIKKAPKGAVVINSVIRTHDHVFIGDALYPLSYIAIK